MIEPPNRPEAVGQHAGDGAGAVAELQGLAEAGLGGGGHAEVADRGESHAHKTDRGREDRADEEGDRPPIPERLGQVIDALAPKNRRTEIITIKTPTTLNWR